MDGDPFGSAGSVSEFLAAWLNCGLLSDSSEALLQNYYQNWRHLESERLRYWYEQQLLEVEELISRTARARILEVGSGLGTEALWLAWCGADVVGIELQDELAAVARERLRVLERYADTALSCRFETGSITDFSDRQGFDIIWMEQAFHHMEPRNLVTDKIAELLKPGGHVVVSEANAWNPLIQAKLYRLRGRKTVIEVDSPSGPIIWGNERVLTVRRLSRLFADVGIDTQKVRYYRCFPAGSLFDKLFWLEKPLASLRYSHALTPMFTHYSFVGCRRLHLDSGSTQENQFVGM